MTTELFVDVKTRRLESANQVEDCLDAIESGWLQTTSGVWQALGKRAWHQQSGLPAKFGEQTALDGSFVLSTTTSAALRHCGDHWLWTEVCESATPGQGRPAQVRDHAFVAIGGGRVKYRVYWASQPEGPADCAVQVWRPWVERFVGFDSDNR